MKKKIVAYLLCMAMGVSLLPMPVTQAADQGAVVYEEDTTTGEEQDSYVQIKGLKAFADCGNATNKPDAIVDGDKSTYWHSAWKGEMQPEKQEAYTEMSKNNNIILKLAQTSAVKKIVYLSNGENSNGTISKCNLYIKQKQDNTEKFEQVGNEPYTLKFDQSGVAEIDFETAFENVAEIKIEVLNTNGDPSNTFISGKELSVFQDEEQTEAIKIMANAECSSQKDQGIAKLVDGKEETVYHSTWGDDSGPTLEDGEEFEGKKITEIVRPETTTKSSELIKNNKIYILLPKEENVARLVYTSRQKEKDGRITGVNIYVSKKEKLTYSEVENWTKVSEETVNWADSEEDQVFDFKPEQEGVRWICLEVKHSAGSEEDKFINAAEIAVEVKKTELQKAIEELQNLLNDENYKNAYDNPFDYTKESWREFQDAYNKAEAILKKENLFEQDIPDIRSAKTNLITAKDNLIGIVEKPTLNLAKPEVGKKFPKAAFENTEDTDFSKIMDIETVWKDSDSKDVTNETIQDYKDYTAEIKLKIKDDAKKILKSEDVDLKISGVSETITGTLSDDEKTLTLNYSFSQGEEDHKDAEEALKTIKNQTIDISEKDDNEHYKYAPDQWTTFSTARDAVNGIDNTADTNTIRSAVNNLKKAKDELDKHKLTFVEKKDADCSNEENGKEAYYKCNCGKEYYYYDEEAKGLCLIEESIEDWGVINYDDNHEYNYSKLDYQWAYTTDDIVASDENVDIQWNPIDKDTEWTLDFAQKVTAVRCIIEVKCTKCGEKKEKEKIITKEAVEIQQPTCTAKGSYTYKVTLGDYSKDENGENKMSTIKIPIQMIEHNLEKTEAVAATCEKDGNIEYYTCKTCKKYFSDKDGKKEIEENSWVVKATGHQIVEEVKKQPTKKAEGQLVRHCKNCDYVKETLALPKKEITIYVGAKAKEVPKVASTYNTSDYRIAYVKAKNAKKYEKYFNLKNANKNGNLKVTIKANSKKLSQVKLSTIPLKVTVAGKEYKTNVKVKIKAPKITITTKTIEFGGTRGTRYCFDYNVKGATKIKVRAKKLAFRNKEFNRYISTPKSNEKYTYFNIKESDLKNLGNKISFEIVAYYGKNVSEKYKKTVSAK